LKRWASHTEAGFALQFRAVAQNDKPFKELFGDIAERYGKSLEEVVREARDMWQETMYKLHKDVTRVADEAAGGGGGALKLAEGPSLRV